MQNGTGARVSEFHHLPLAGSFFKLGLTSASFPPLHAGVIRSGCPDRGEPFAGEWGPVHRVRAARRNVSQGSAVLRGNNRPKED